ncbi:MAG: hypothetical protein CFE44_23395 [Burkholderiales bacterium PBB4]|nr:MAG: hypothetical protein CFE44_23395 [Burkholderiales bacterium PBB4]
MRHERRTPLNAIMGFSQLLELDRGLSPSSRRFAGETLNAGKHLLDLINDVLDLAQVESGRIALAPEPLLLAKIGHDVMTLMKPLADQRGVILQPLGVDGLVVRADRMRLKQVLVNLVSNAIKYNRAAGTVSLAAAALDEQTLRITVRDTGVGIAPERLPHVFEPFNRLGAESGSIEGTGIGLSISRRLVELMGGQIGVNSTPGEGSEFWLDLPWDPDPRIEHAQPSAELTVETAAAPLRAGRVLYVEDNLVNVELMKHIMGRHDSLQLLSATSAAQGLELAYTHRPDLILLDINLPDGNGYAVLAELRADPRTRNIPAVAVTASAMPSDKKRALDAGFNEYIAKPIDVKDLDAMLARVLGHSAAVR